MQHVVHLGDEDLALSGRRPSDLLVVEGTAMSVGKAASEIAAAAWDSAGIGSAASPDPPDADQPRGRGVIFVAIMLGMLVAALAVTAVTTALPTIAADLGGTGHHSWAVTSYLLSATSVIPLAGKLGDVFGRKRVLEATTTLSSSPRCCAGGAVNDHAGDVPCAARH